MENNSLFTKKSYEPSESAYCRQKFCPYAKASFRDLPDFCDLYSKTCLLEEDKTCRTWERIKNV